jgi:hypothetical protein
MTTKTKALAFALAVATFSLATTAAFAADNGLPESGNIGHGPVVRHPPIVSPPIVKPNPVHGLPLPPVKSRPLVAKETSQPNANNAPLSGLRETGVVRVQPKPTCPAGSVALGSRCVESPGLPSSLGSGPLGGGGFGTVLPGGGNLDRCDEEFRCEGSVD